MTLHPCTACRGSGRLSLSKPYQDTYDRLSTEWQTTDRVFREHAGTTERTTVCNRLTWLLGKGLIERKGKARGSAAGRQIEWRRKR
jgi:hypothetical protein